MFFVYGDTLWYDKGNMTNQEIAQLLRKISAAYLVLGENRFKIIAYDRAADSVEHETHDLKEYWKKGTLDDVPGIGSSISSNLDELFRTGTVKHFNEILSRVPGSMFPLLLVPGVGPKKAYRLVTELGLKHEKSIINDLEKAAKGHKIASLEGFGEKSEEDILASIAIYRRGQIKENRMPLPVADAVAQDVIGHLKKNKHVKQIDVLGSLRRQVSTIGDIDLAVATEEPENVIEHFLTYEHQKITEKGPTGATLLLHNGRQVDLRVQTPGKYGAMLQYFTGSKNHNIRLREYALSKGLSLNEYGIKHVKTQKTSSYGTEEAFYHALGLAWIPPEIREDRGELEASIHKKLPNLPELSDIKGDLHMHTSYFFETSHDIGKNSLAEHLDAARDLDYQYIGISDHNPSITNHTDAQIADIMKRRKEHYDKAAQAWAAKSHKKIGVFVMCEVDILPDGRLALPDAAFDYVDAVVVSLHSSFTQDRDTVTRRIVKALSHHPKVRIWGHPTGRLLGSREGVNADWEEVFAVAKKHDIALEINAYPERLDLPDPLVYDAVKAGIKFTIDTDSHAVQHMSLMRYGVSVARRGWAQKDDIRNTMGYNDFKNWLMPKEGS